MKTAGNRLAAALLAAALTLAACGGRGQENQTAEFPSIPGGTLIGCCTDGEYMYLLTREADGRTLLCRSDLSGARREALEEYRPAQPPEEGTLRTLGPVLAPDCSLWLYEAWSVPREGPEEGRDDFHRLRQLDAATGREGEQVDLSEAIRALGGGIFDITGFTLDCAGNVCLAGDRGLAVLDIGGSLLFSLRAAPGGYAPPGPI